jgi:hypothetical protein
MKARLIITALGVALAAALQAHRVSARWELTGNTLTVLARAEDTPAAGAEVELRDATGAVLASGVLDASGRFEWPLAAGAGDLTVVVNAGPGHRRTLVIPAAQLRVSADAAAGPAPAAANPVAPAPVSRHGKSDGVEPLAVRVVVGLTFLLAATAAWLGYQNHRRLAALEQRLASHEKRG